MPPPLAIGLSTPVSVSPDQTVQFEFCGPQDHARRGVVMVTFNSERPPYQRADSARVFQATPVSANPDVRNVLGGDRVFPNHTDYRFAGVIMERHAQMGPDSPDETYVRGRVATQIYGLASIYFPCARVQKKDIHIGDTLGIAFIDEDEAYPNNGKVVPAALGVYRGMVEVADRVRLYSHRIHRKILIGPRPVNVVHVIGILRKQCIKPIASCIGLGWRLKSR